MKRRGRQVVGSSDDDLLEAFVDGSPTAAAAIVDRHAPGVLRLAIRMLGNRADAEEVTQEVMLRLWQNAPRWQSGRAKLSTWLWRVTANLCTDRLRRARTTSIDSIPEPEDQGAPAVEQVIENQRLEVLYSALDALPERQRSAVVLRHIEGMSNPEIAEILETSVEAVESLLTRGLRELRRQLGHRREELGWTA